MHIAAVTEANTLLVPALQHLHVSLAAVRGCQAQGICADALHCLPSDPLRHVLHVTWVGRIADEHCISVQ